MQTRRDVLATVTCLAGLTFMVSCDSEPRQASAATLLELDSQIGALEEDAEDFGQ
jgi:hypothetical protein